MDAESRVDRADQYRDETELRWLIYDLECRNLGNVTFAIPPYVRARFAPEMLVTKRGYELAPGDQWYDDLQEMVYTYVSDGVAETYHPLKGIRYEPVGWNIPFDVLPAADGWTATEDQLTQVRRTVARQLLEDRWVLVEEGESSGDFRNPNEEAAAFAAKL